MAYVQVGSVTVQKDTGTEALDWATRVTVDRKGNLHVYGHRQQHRVFEEGTWKGYLAAAPEGYKLPNQLKSD